MSGMNAATGRKLTTKAHISQSIADILLTPVGSRVQRREYGSMLPELIDQPQSDALVLQLMAASVIAITQWEPRIKITSVVFDIKNTSGTAQLQLNAVRVDTGMAENFSVDIT